MQVSVIIDGFAYALVHPTMVGGVPKMRLPVMPNMRLRGPETTFTVAGVDVSDYNVFVVGAPHALPTDAAPHSVPSRNVVVPHDCRIIEAYNLDTHDGSLIIDGQAVMVDGIREMSTFIPAGTLLASTMAVLVVCERL